MLFVSELLLCVLVAAVFEPTSADYDPDTVHLVENFDPAEADPRGNITCLGPLPEYDPSSFSAFDISDFTLQELCAKPQYGGRAPRQHMGGWCAETRLTARPRAVVFDISVGSAVATALPFNPRLANYCRERCFCNYNLDDRSQQPWVADRTLGTYLTVKSETYQIPLERKINLNAAFQMSVNLGDEVARSAFYMYQKQSPSGGSYRSHPTDVYWVSLDSQFEVTCRGPRPHWPLPGPLTLDDLQGNGDILQQICAVKFFGGHARANAGAYCRRNPDGSAEVFFSDELTPRLEWTWDNLAASATIRRLCHQYCYCTNVPAARWDNGTLNAVWNFLEDVAIVPRQDQSVDIVAGSGAAQTTIRVLPAASPEGGSQAAGTCGDDGRQFCPMPWPSDVLGPKPTAGLPSLASASIPPLSPASTSEPQLPTCGATCHSNGDCRGPDAPLDCRCLALSTADDRQANVDPVFPSALCLVFSEALISLLSKNSASLPRRDQMPDRHNEAEVVWGCVCNATYISKGCCESSDGLIWEAAASKLGEFIG
ncbi:MAG: hypothetical protein M1817_002259 [Caeruleum heppii]|nr:MAG: hypothetical protein M1817_002259 [Caeruleum heppii]